MTSCRWPKNFLEVPQELVRTALDLELADGAVIADMVGAKRCVFLAGLYRAERGIAERLLQLGTGALPWPWIDPDKAVPWIAGLPRPPRSLTLPRPPPPTPTSACVCTGAWAPAPSRSALPFSGADP